MVMGAESGKTKTSFFSAVYMEKKKAIWYKIGEKSNLSCLLRGSVAQSIPSGEFSLGMHFGLWLNKL